MSKHLAYLQQSVSTAAAVDISGFSAALQRQIAGALSYITITPETQAIRFRVTNAPTTTVGTPVATGTYVTYDDPAAILDGSFKMVAQTGTASVSIDLYSA